MSDFSNHTATSSATWRNDRPASAAQTYDPWLYPELFQGVLMRRAFAFLVDVFVISIPVVLASIFIAIFGVVTFGIGWGLFWLLSPASVIWAVVYYGMSLGGRHSATWGMRMMGIQMRTTYGAPGYFLLGAMHAVLFWISVSFLTPFVLLVGFFNARRQLLQDMVLGTLIVNTHAAARLDEPAMR